MARKGNPISVNVKRIMNILRQLSTHLTSVKSRLTSTFPISHRISGAFLARATIVLVLYLLCLKMGWISLFLSLLSRVGVSLGGRALSFFLIKMGCSGGLALAIGFAVRALLTPFLANMVLPAGVDSGASGSAPASGSTEGSLVGHPSNESSEKDIFFTPNSSLDSASDSDKPINGVPDEKGSLDFISEEEQSNLWKKEVIRAFFDRLQEADFDPQGKIGKITEGEIEDALRLDSSPITRGEMQKFCRDFRKRPWPSYEEADRTSVYARIWGLLEKSRRPE